MEIFFIVKGEYIMYNAILNDKNENTKKIIHIMVTTLCNAIVSFVVIRCIILMIFHM